VSSLYHKVYFADSRELLRDIPSQTIQLVVTSPPYWNARDYEHKLQIGYNQTFDEYADSLMKVWEESVRALLPDGKIAVNIGNIYYNKNGEKRKTTANLTNLVWDQLNSFDNMRFMGTIYWEKSTMRKQKVLMGSYPYPSTFLISTAFEAIFVFRKIGNRKVAKKIKELSRITKDEFRAYRNPSWRINGVYNGHPAAFPSELPRRLIKMYSFVGDIVLDPYLGSGTTSIEAARLARNSIGLEVNRKFLEVMKKLIYKNLESLRSSTIDFYDSKKHLICKFVNGVFENGRN
jgi:site-specific DNA-methyltransferase (adenine-specific)